MYDEICVFMGVAKARTLVELKITSISVALNEQRYGDERKKETE